MQNPSLNPYFRQYSPKLVQSDKSCKDPDNSSRSQDPKPRRPSSIDSSSPDSVHIFSLPRPNPRRPSSIDSSSSDFVQINTLPRPKLR